MTSQSPARPRIAAAVAGGPGPRLVAAYGGHLAAPPEPHPGGEGVVEGAVAQRLQQGQALDDALCGSSPGSRRRAGPTAAGRGASWRPGRGCAPQVQPLRWWCSSHDSCSRRAISSSCSSLGGDRGLAAGAPAAADRDRRAEHGEHLADVGLAVERRQLGPRPPGRVVGVGVGADVVLVDQPRDPLPAVDRPALAGVQRRAEGPHLREQRLGAEAGDLGVPGVDEQPGVGRPEPRREPLVGDAHVAAEHHGGRDVLVDRGGHHLVELDGRSRRGPGRAWLLPNRRCDSTCSSSDVVGRLADDRDRRDRRLLAVGIERALAAALRELGDHGEGQVGLAGEQHVVDAPLDHVVDEEPGGDLVLADRVDDPLRDPGQVAAPPVLGLPGLVHPQQRAHRVVAGDRPAALDRVLDDRHQPLRLGAVGSQHGQPAQGVPAGAGGRAAGPASRPGAGR